MGWSVYGKQKFGGIMMGWSVYSKQKYFLWSAYQNTHLPTMTALFLSSELSSFTVAIGELSASLIG